MKKFLKSLPLLGRVFTGLGNLRWKYLHWKTDPNPHLLKILNGCEDLSVVQIGSNDGSTGDPICALLARKPSWKALLVEPVPSLFERLKVNYAGNKNVQFDNVAVAETAGKNDFYYLDAGARQHLPELPFWFDQLGSFDREHIIRHLGTKVEPFIVSTEIPTLPLAAVLERNQVNKIDLLHIDTEGYEWKILRQLDQNKFHPKVILFEHKHLTKAAKREGVAFVRPNYQVTDLGYDYLCRRVERS